MKLSFFLGGVMKHTAKDLADAIGAIVEGDGSTEVTGVAAPERASSSDLIFANATKHVSRAESSAAKCVVLPAGLSVAGKTVLRAERSEEHTSELQSRSDLVCRLLLEKKKKH